MVGWDTDPFVAIKIAAVVVSIYGRGTCDMKGFLAGHSVSPEWCKQALPRPVHIAFPMMKKRLSRRAFAHC
jgi:acetylornithine deacetylase